MAGILLKNITKIYPNKFKAIEDLNLEIKDKEFLVLVGSSGCGKSTLLRIIAGLEDVTDGTVVIGDNVVNDISPKDRNISMVFQDYALYPHMNVYDNMAFSLKLKKNNKREIKNKVYSAAKKLEIENLLYNKPSTLSGGQKQRVALGRAIIRSPEVFLFDEPLSNLDAKLRSQMRIELIRLHKQLNTTFLYVTHDQTEAMTMGERIVVMKDGEIQQIDTPIDLYNNPCNMFTAGFIGLPQINFIEGILTSRDDKTYLRINGIDNKEFILNNVLQEFIEKKVVIGIRPEKLFLIDEDLDINESIIVDNCYSEAVELLGSDQLVYFNSNGIKLVCKMFDNINILKDKNYNLYFNIKDIHFFDFESERKIELWEKKS